jgi:hypothetical protein
LKRMMLFKPFHCLFIESIVLRYECKIKHIGKN